MPGSIESTATDGALTMKFVSRGKAPGWVATTSCTGTLGFDDSVYLDYSYHPNPVNGFVNIVSKDVISEIQVFNVQGQLLYSNRLNDRTTKVDLSAYATGAYFFKMKINNQTVNFKVVKI
ncbi:T9SS type A sorting domain-containing protein [Flavobacterium sp.]|uniref:T9SS type A sorting domain-containing protein n=1 Tax=Flavobacterium sp. TaxID=239 RepID=UPI00262CC569|nr:T9SS type A sorting domain-containing protein [Flavobacterium sp.]